MVEETPGLVICAVAVTVMLTLSPRTGSYFSKKMHGLTARDMAQVVRDPRTPSCPGFHTPFAVPELRIW